MSFFNNCTTVLGYTAGAIALASSIACTILNAIFATTSTNVAGIQMLGFVSTGINVLSATFLVFFIFCYIYKINTKPIPWKAGFCWRLLLMGIFITSLALIASLSTLIWTTLSLNDLSPVIAGRGIETLLVIWWSVWGSNVAFEAINLGILCWITKRCFETNATADPAVDDVIPTQPMEERPTTRDTNRSFRSQDLTLMSSPPVPSNRSSLKSTRSSKIHPTGSRTKLIRHNSLPRNSAKSSFDFGTEVSSIDDGFDGWDTSDVGREMRRTLQASPPAGGVMLETIPGSRPESPAKALDGPFLPQSPYESGIESATTGEDQFVSSSPVNYAMGTFTTPLTSSPNFSRPTSRSYSINREPPSLSMPPGTPPMEELIHPLFRESSQSPSPTPSPGTSIYASPTAGQTISHRALHRMRSGSLPQQSSPLAERESIDEHGRDSPGPSIAEEEELPPILPGFILSAGQRSSLVGYGKRKSVKGRESSSDDSTGPSF